MNEKSSSLLFTEWMKLEGSSGPSGLIRQGYLEQITQDYYITVYFIAVFYGTLDIERQFQFKACQAQIVCLEFSIWLLTQTSLRTMGGLLGLISFIKGSFLKDRSTHSHYQVVKENWAYLRTCLLRFILHYQLEHTSEDHVGNLQFSLCGLISGFILVKQKVRQRDTCKSHYIHSVCITYTLFTVWVIKLGISFICRKYLKILVFLSQIISTWKILIQKWGYRNENHFSGQNQSHNLCYVIASTEASWAWLYMKVKMMMKITLCFCVDLLQRLKKKEAAFLCLPSEEEEHQSCFQTRVSGCTQTRAALDYTTFHFSFVHFQQKVHQNCGEIWCSRWRVQCSFYSWITWIGNWKGTESIGQNGHYFYHRGILRSSGITGNLWGGFPVWDTVHGLLCGREQQAPIQSYC